MTSVTKKKFILTNQPYIFLELNQNNTLEERVSLLELQVIDIQQDVTALGVDLVELEGDVNFLFDETVIQDERLFQLETETETIEEEVEGTREQH